MADRVRRDNAIDDRIRSADETGAPPEDTSAETHARELQRAFRDRVDDGAMLLTELVRASATHDATAALDRLVERWTDTERRLLEESTRRIHDFQLRLRHEWEAVRQLHEASIQELEARGAALSEAHVHAARAAHDSILHARARLDAFEKGISSQMAEAARDFREAAAMLRASGSPTESRTVTGVPRRLHHLIAAMLGGLAALLIVSGYLYVRLAAANEQAAAAQKQVRELRQLTQTEAASTKQALQTVVSDALSAADRTERMVNVLAAADLQRFELGGESGAPAANGQALWSPSRGLVLAAARAPQPPAGQIGQAWLVTTHGAISLGFTSPDGQGRLSAAFDAPPGLPGVVTGFMVTLERAGGSAKPTGRVLLASSRNRLLPQS